MSISYLPPLTSYFSRSTSYVLRFTFYLLLLTAPACGLADFRLLTSDLWIMLGDGLGHRLGEVVRH